MEAISTKNLCKVYGNKHVVKNLNVSIPERASYGFIGRNGACSNDFDILKIFDYQQDLEEYFLQLTKVLNILKMDLRRVVYSKSSYASFIIMGVMAFACVYSQMTTSLEGVLGTSGLLLFKKYLTNDLVDLIT